MVAEAARPARNGHLPGSGVAPWRSRLRYWLSRAGAWVLVRGLFRVRVEGRDRLPDGPAVLCFNHLNWLDPFVLMATLPMRPRLYFFGPREVDMSVGGRNRLMIWTGTTVPYRPGKDNLLAATRSVAAVFAAGGVLAIAGEGRIHRGERTLLPLDEGAAYFALRSHVPVVPLAINGTSWLRFGRRLRVSVGRPIPAPGRPTRSAIAQLTAETAAELQALIADYPDPAPPGRVGRWFTELFNDWEDPPSG